MASTTSPTNRLTAWRMNVTKNMQQWQQQAYQYEHGLIDEDDAETVRSVIQRYIDGLKTIASDEMFRISLLDNEQQQEDTENWVQRMTPAKELKRQLMMVEKSLTPLPLAPTQPSSRSSVISERYAPSTGRAVYRAVKIGQQEGKFDQNYGNSAPFHLTKSKIRTASLPVLHLYTALSTGSHPAYANGEVPRQVPIPMSSVPESEQIRTAISSRQSVVSVPPLHPTVPLANEFEALSMYSYITPFTNMPQNNSFYTYNTAPPIPTRPPSAINFGHQPSGSVYVGQTINEAKPQPVKIESKLPRMSIPKFDGTIEKFPEFYQTFIERVDSQNITAQDKLSYLLQSLSGKAKAALDGYAATAENYERCLNLLKAEYGKNDVICRSIKETLERVSEPRYNIDSLLNFTNEVCGHLRRLASLSDKREDDVIMKIVQKIPQPWKQSYSEEFRYGRVPTNEDLQNFLREQFRITRELKMTPENSRSTDQFKGNRKTWTPSSEASKTTGFKKDFWSSKYPKPDSSEPNNKSLRPCLFCNEQGHPCAMCPTVKNRKDRLARLKDRCHVCISNRHTTTECPSTWNCKTCNGRHHSSICPKDKSLSLTAVAPATNSDRHILLTTTVKAKAPEKEKVADAVIILDTGSQKSYITNQFASRLGLKSEASQTILINGFGGTTHAEQSKVVELEILSDKGSIPIVANTLKQIVSGTVDVPDKNGKTTKQNLDILIGLDFFFEFVDAPKEVKKGVTCVKSAVGDLYLIADESKTASSHGLLAFEGFDRQDLFGWNSEYGDLQPVQTKEDLQTLKFFDETTTRDNDRYTVSIPFKEDRNSLPSNFGLARGQLNGTLCRLSKDPALLYEYNEIIRQQLDSGVLEEAPPRNDGHLHYLPHHPITKEESITTKTRIVINCSAKASKTDKSLNDCVHQGPDLLPHLTGINIRSRIRQFVVSGDVEKAFHQIIIAEEDRDYVRILWIRDFQKPFSNENLIALRFARVLFGLKTSPFILLAVLRKHLMEFHDNKEILKNIYVDNVFIFTDDKDFALAEKKKLKEVLAKAGMNLRCFFSNDAEIDSTFAENERYAGGTKKILGIEFDCAEDCYIFHIAIAEIGFQWTPARIIKAKLQVFDPMGFLLPAYVSIKHFLHKLAKDKHPLKKPLKADDETTWRELMTDFASPQTIRVSRFIGTGSEFELHVFCDASSQFVAAAAYIRVKTTDGIFKTTLMMAKNHVKEEVIPEIDNQKIPKLELVALVVGAQLMEKVTEELDITLATRFLWSDSQIALAWINKCPDIPFVARRIPSIIKLQCKYGFVQSQFNPADLPTRGCSPSALQQHQQWWHGPPWLNDPEESWPQQAVSMKMVQVSERFLLKADVSSHPPSIPHEIDNLDDKFYCPIIDLYRVSSYSRAIAISICFLKATKIFLGKIGQKISSFATKSKVDSWQDAKVFLLHQEQKRYASVLEASNKVGLRENVFVFIDRFDNSRGVKSKLPVLPKDSRLAALIVIHVHHALLHAGVPQTLANVRKHVWILKGRKLVSEIIHNCPVCRRFSAAPFRLPDYAQHPAERVNKAEPFKFIGLDFFGPMHLYNNDKRWGLILTCLTTRAIHIELVPDLSVSSFIRSLSCFTSRRRIPTVIYSDNASTFRATSELFALITDTYPHHPQALAFLTRNNIDWRFITERAPWQGGMYERLIGVVKSTFKKVIGSKNHTDHELRTVMCSIESATNQRTLTYVDTDSLTPIRPCDFLGQADPKPLLVPEMHPDSDDDNDPTWMPRGPAGREELLKQLNRHNARLSDTWKHWSHDYLNALRESQAVKSRNPRSTTNRLPIIGEVVIIYDDQQPRQHWRLATVKALLPSRDGVIRSAVVTTANRRDKNRPINHLYPLELNH